MTELIIENLSLITLLPLWIFLIIMVGRFFSIYVNKSIIHFLTLMSSAIGAFVTYFALINISASAEWDLPFIQINDFIISFGLRADKLSLILALLLFIISFCVQLYAIFYMQDEKKSYKFFALLNLFNFSMAFLLFSPNLYQLYFFWELVSLVSYLLIGFDYKNIEHSIASKRVFIINRIGDTALLSGIVISSYFMYEYAGNKTFTILYLNDLNSISALLMGYSAEWIFYVISSLFIIAAIVKSAQFPFHIWLQDAMKAHTPVSALLHSATMVVAGIYLLIRIMPFLTLYPNLLYAILWIGIITAIICSILASIETNPKKILAYSTSANLGLMFISLGLSNIKACIVFLCLHAFIKATLFILIPKNQKTMTKIGFTLFIIGCTCLAFMSKDVLGFKNEIFSCLISFLTAYYIFRLAYLFEKTNKKASIFEYIPSIIMLGLNLVIYFIYPPKIALTTIFALFGLIICKRFPNFNNPPKLTEKLLYIYIPKLYIYTSQIMNNIDNRILMNYKPIKIISITLVGISHFIEKNIMDKYVLLIANTAKYISKLDALLQTKNIQTYNAYAFILVTIIITLVIIGYTYLLPVGS